MSELKAIVEDQLLKIEDEYKVVTELAKSYSALQKQQVMEIEKTSVTLLPVMRYIKKSGFRFTDHTSGTYSNLGPVLHYDSNTHSQFIFYVDEDSPAVLDLNSQQMTKISYEELLQRVDFISLMKNLLLILTYHQELKKMFENGIEKIEHELKEFEGVERNDQQ